MQRYSVSFAFLTAAAALTVAACGGKSHYIPGTRVDDTERNRGIIEVVETYRMAVERKDAAALMLMASEHYWEDGGTPSGKDDYGYKELKHVLTGRFQKSEDVRYSMRYMNIYRRCPGGESATNEGCRAYVDVLIDASFTVDDARGEEMRRDKRDQNQLVLVWNGDAWKFLSGM